MKRAAILLVFVCAALVGGGAAKNEDFWYNLERGLKIVVHDFLQDLTTPRAPTPDKAFMTLPEYSLTAGYHFEEQKIVVPDGYILSAHRIKGRLDEEESEMD